jgi:hypothetical protein
MSKNFNEWLEESKTAVRIDPMSTPIARANPPRGPAYNLTGDPVRDVIQNVPRDFEDGTSPGLRTLRELDSQGRE